jgi:RNA polymerase sigma factor (sigma-70 family)
MYNFPTMDTLELLFDDIKQIPILTSASQELWLGIQIRTPQTWGARGFHNNTILPAIYADLKKCFAGLKTLCARKDDLVTPQLEVWIVETLKAYRNIYELRHSNLHKFVKSTSRFSEDTSQKLTDQAYNIAESLCLLPEPMLEYLTETIQNRSWTGRLPTTPQLPEQLKYYPLQELWQDAEERAERARITLVTGYLRYVLRIARNYVGRGVDYLDLVQEGVLGLMRAAERFDYRERSRFAWFASSWIRQGISRAIADHGRTIRLPVHMHERVCALQKQVETDPSTSILDACVQSHVSSREDTEDSENEDIEDEETDTMSHKSSPTVKMRRKAYRLFEYCQPLIPLDLKLPEKLLEQVGITDDTDVTVADCVADYETEGATGISHEQSEWQQIVQMVFGAAAKPKVSDPREIRFNISARDLEVIRLRYGLDDGQERTLEEVGQHFNLTRERIRQLEKRTWEKLRPILRQMGIVIDFTAQSPYFALLPSPVSTYLDERFSIEHGTKDTDMTSSQQIDYYLAQLPGSDWQTYRIPGISTRQEQILAAMRVMEAPAHYSIITEQVNDLVDESPMDTSYVYGLLMKYEDAFVRLGEGFFSLAEWERQRAAETEPMLPFCPATFPDPPEQPYAFFESVMILREALQQSATTHTALRALAKWVGLPWSQPRWICQGALSAYYVVGVIPYVFYVEDEEQPLTLTLPDADLPTLRTYCLDMLSRRLQAMPEFWWVLQRHQPIQVGELVRLFVPAHPLELDDVANRLNLLTGIGAVQKSTYGGRYQLTHLGETLAARWAQQPAHISTVVSDPFIEDDWDFAEFSFE